MKKQILFLNLLISLLSLSSEAQQATIMNVNSMGTGCSNGTVHSVISPDGTELSILFDQFAAQLNEGNRSTVDRKFCNLNIQMNVESGWSVSLLTAEYRGFVYLDETSRALHSVLYSFDAHRIDRAFNQKEFRGPLTEDYLLDSELTPSQAVWSDCRRTNLNLQILINLISQSRSRDGKSEASISLDSIDSSIQQNFELAWRRCDTGEMRKDRGRWGQRRFTPPPSRQRPLPPKRNTSSWVRAGTYK